MFFYFFVFVVAHLTRKTGSPPGMANQTQRAATTQPKKEREKEKEKGKSGVALQLQPKVLQSSS